MFKIFKVSGTSMQPTLMSGDYIFATKCLNNFLKKNSLVIFFDKTHAFIIKRVKKINKENLVLKSDNPTTKSSFCNVPIIKNQSFFLILFVLKKKYMSFILNLIK